MSDSILSAILDQALSDDDGPDPASLAALGDRLCEASAEDRLILLRRLVIATRKLAQFRTATTMALRDRPGAQRFTGSQYLPLEADPEHQKHARRQILYQAGKRLVEATEIGRWYAFCIELNETRGSYTFDPYVGGPRELQLRLTISPLDGGPVMEARGET